METKIQDFLHHYRAGVSYRVAAKRADVTTTMIKALAVTDPEFAAQMKQIHEERIFEARRALIESLPDVVDALIANAKSSKASLSISAARLVFQAAGVKLPDGGRPRTERKEKAQPSTEEGLLPIDEDMDDLDELQQIAKGIS